MPITNGLHPISPTPRRSQFVRIHGFCTHPRDVACGSGNPYTVEATWRGDGGIPLAVNAAAPLGGAFANHGLATRPDPPRSGSPVDGADLDRVELRIGVVARAGRVATSAPQRDVLRRAEGLQRFDADLEVSGARGTSAIEQGWEPAASRR